MATAAPPIALENPIITVNGTELRPEVLDALVEARVESELRLPGRLKLRFQDPDGKLAESAKFPLGAEIVLKMPRGGGTLIEAQVTGLGYEASVGATPRDRFDGRTGRVNELLVIAHDRGYRLTRASSVQGLMNIKSSDIVSTIASEAGLSPDATATSRTFDYAARAMSGADMLNALADREGYDWWVGSGHKLHFKPLDKTSVATLKLGTQQLESFSVQASGLVPDKVSVRGWQQKPAQHLQHESETSASDAWPSSVTWLDDFKNPGSKLGSSTVVVSRTGSASSEDVTTVGDAIRDRMVAAAVLARGEGAGNAAIVIGKSVSVAGAGPADGTYHVTKVEHVVRRASFKTRFVAGNRRPTSLVDAVGAREAPRFPLRRDMLVVGTVTALGDGENKGFVKVKFPGVDAGQTFESTWARFLSLGAGAAGRGAVLLPEAGDQVLVGFEDSDMHRPVVLGGLYASDADLGTWDVVGGQVKSRRITSRLGHVVELKDGDDDTQKHVLITVAGGAKGKVELRVGADKVDLTAPTGVPVKLTSGQASVELTQDGSIKVEATKIELKATAEMSLAAPKIAIKADTQLQMSGLEVELSGTAKTDVKAAGPVTVKGAMVAIN